jgi:hypothetical protein
MSRSLVVYAVPFGEVRAAVGSCSQTLLHRLLHEDATAEYAEAAEEMIMRGKPPFHSAARELAFVQEALCATLGRRLNSDSLSGTSLTFIERMDVHVAAAALGVTLESLMYGGGPIESLPWPEEFPSTGTWSVAQVMEAKVVYERTRPSSADAVVDEVLRGIGGWLEIAAEMEWGLVGLYY